MFNVYDMMKSGMSAEEIAAEFTQNLNDAETRIEAERIEEARLAEEAARAEQERIDARAAKHQEFEEAIGDLLCAIARHYPELGLDVEDITSESVEGMTDLVLMLLDLEAMKRHRPKITAEIRRAKDGKPAVLKEVPIDPFAAFFKQFGL